MLNHLKKKKKKILHALWTAQVLRMVLSINVYLPVGCDGVCNCICGVYSWLHVCDNECFHSADRARRPRSR